MEISTATATGERMLCKRCQELEAITVVRAEPVCRSCILKYVNTKVIKRMESFRVRNSTAKNPRKLLLPVSFGVSSVTLVHLLDGQLQGQIGRMNRTGYELLIVHVKMALENSTVGVEDRMTNLKEKYPRHRYQTVDIADVFNSSVDTPELLKQISLPSNTDTLVAEVPTREPLENLMVSLPSATSRSDIISILRTRLLVEIARREGCEGIVWGDSTTRLAERTLAEVAKGRGFTLPWQLSDGASPYGVDFKYPLRDLLKKELVTYSLLTSPPLTPLIIIPEKVGASTSSKNTTIDDLMVNYFQSVEENFPSIVANVVRTSSKLSSPPMVDHNDMCEICEMPIAAGTEGIYGWGGDQEPTNGVTRTDLTRQDSAKLCYGCTRSTLGTTVLLNSMSR